MKKYILTIILILSVSSLSYSQFVIEPPIVEFDVDFGDDSFGVLHYFGYRVSEDDFWEEIIIGSVFDNLIDPSETLILSSFTLLEDNIALDDYIKNTMIRNKITVYLTLFANYYGGFTYVVNYSFDNYETFGFISIDSIGYVSPSVQPEVSPPAINTTPSYTIITGRAYATSITQDELRKRINLQNYKEIASWLRWGSSDIVESTGVQFNNLINVLVNNFKIERYTAENTVRNIGNNISYHWLINNNGRVTEWIIYFREK
jgi:hypothetical protein